MQYDDFDARLLVRCQYANYLLAKKYLLPLEWEDCFSNLQHNDNLNSFL